MKESQVILNFKKGKKEVQENYRLVSFTRVLGKVMKHIDLETICKFGKDEKLIWSSQHRFIK